MKKRSMFKNIFFPKPIFGTKEEREEMKEDIKEAFKQDLKEGNFDVFMPFIKKYAGRALELDNLEHEKEVARAKSFITEQLASANQVEADYLYRIAETNSINAKTKEQLARAMLVQKAVKVIDPAEMPAKFKNFIIRNLMAPEAADAKDPETQEELDKYLIQKEKALADRETDETEFRKWKAERAKKNEL